MAKLIQIIDERISFLWLWNKLQVTSIKPAFCEYVHAVLRSIGVGFFYFDSISICVVF
jgi:hypothetical protein